MSLCIRAYAISCIHLDVAFLPVYSRFKAHAHRPIDAFTQTSQMYTGAYMYAHHVTMQLADCFYCNALQFNPMLYVHISLHTP